MIAELKVGNDITCDCCGESQSMIHPDFALLNSVKIMVWVRYAKTCIGSMAII